MTQQKNFQTSKTRAFCCPLVFWTSLTGSVMHLQMFQKKVAEREAWQEKYNKEEKKKRYVAAGLAEKHKNKKQRTS